MAFLSAAVTLALPLALVRAFGTTRHMRPWLGIDRVRIMQPGIKLFTDSWYAAGNTDITVAQQTAQQFIDRLGNILAQADDALALAKHVGAAHRIRRNHGQAQLRVQQLQVVEQVLIVLCI